MFDFLRRQFKTKSGRNALIGIVAAGVGTATGNVPVLGGIGAIWAGVEFMFLRDKEAKKEEEERADTVKPKKKTRSKR